MKTNSLLQSFCVPSALSEAPGLSCDTRRLEAGDVFVAVPCDEAYEHCKKAIKLGASALVCEQALATRLQQDVGVQSKNITIVPVHNPRLMMSHLASQLYPGQPDVNVAVTGTNGKSSVVAFVRQIWEQLGKPGVSLGTLGAAPTSCAQLPADLHTVKLTTPDAISMHQILDQLAGSGISHCAFEASSHGLDQYRLHHVTLRAAGFTNLTQDHLDYHETIEAYFAAKSRLFTEVLPPEATAVINVGSPYFPALKLLLKGRDHEIISYGVDCDATLKASRVRLGAAEIHFDLSYQELIWPDVTVHVVGNFQIENILCAIGLVMATGVSLESIIPTLGYLKSAPGRMQLVAETENGASVFVDYAHTPDALMRALSALRPHVHHQGRLNVLFGCGGNRDVAKRPIMGGVAAEYADHIYVTDDNPRYENPAYIRAQIMTNCSGSVEIPNRRDAISRAISDLCPHDILLIAGKGHEQGQIIADEIIPFDDAAVVLDIIG